jgi:hypothetical protein
MKGDPGGNAGARTRCIPRRGTARARGALVVAVGLAPCALLAWTACGGTTGREDDPLGTDADGGPLDATLDDAVAADAGTAYDTGAFDVVILYADRVLPDVSVAPEGGEDAAGNGLPNCPPWLSVDDVGNIVPSNDPSQALLIPSDFAANGSVVPADGGVCATYPWYPFTSAFDSKWSTDFAGTGNGSIDPYPPCNWAVEAGTAQAGTAAGESRYALCQSLYICITQSGCAQNATVNPLACLCGTGEAGAACLASGANPEGPCAQQEIAGFEVPASESTHYISEHFFDDNEPDPVPPYYNISLLNSVYSYARTSKLLILGDAGSN